MKIGLIVAVLTAILLLSGCSCPTDYKSLAEHNAYSFIIKVNHELYHPGQPDQAEKITLEPIWSKNGLPSGPPPWSNYVQIVTLTENGQPSTKFEQIAMLSYKVLRSYPDTLIFIRIKESGDGPTHYWDSSIMLSSNIVELAAE